jgi:hypothetical protein
MVLLRSSWGIELVGSVVDIENLTAKVNGSIRSLEDFFISKLDDCVVLRTSRWDAAGDFDEARHVAGEDLKLLNSCIAVQDLGQRLVIGTVFHFLENGRVDQSRTSTAVIRVNVSDQASPNEFKNLVDSARSSNNLRIALSELSPDHGWFEIYKAIEALKRHYLNMDRLLSKFPLKKHRIELMKRTANSYRHATGSYEPIKNPMDLSEAQGLIKEVLLETLRPAMRDVQAPTISFEIPNLTSPGPRKLGLKPLTVPSPDGTAHVGDTLHAPSYD